MKIKIMNFAKKYLVGCAALAIALSAVGCETLTTDSTGSKKKKKDSSWYFFKKKEYQVPQTMNVTWMHDILTLPGKPATRGFGGRFYFYNEKTQAIPVDGDLVVYGFDDTHKQKSSEDLNQATKRFRFTAEQITTHFTEGELGASYSIWIPWDEAYGEPKKIMLIPTFLTKEGRTIRGAAASLNLPGSSKNDPDESTVQQASALSPNALPNQMLNSRNSSVASETSGLRTTTIQVPTSSLMRHSHPTEPSPNAIETQSQQLADASNIVASYLGSNAVGPNKSVTTTQSPPLMEQLPPSALSNMNANIGPPKTMPVTENKMSTKIVNGWVLPEYAPMNWSGLSPRSAPSQFQVPTSQGVQPSSYPIR